MQILTSPKNPRLKEIRRAAGQGQLTDDGFAVAESRHLLEEALAAGVELGGIFLSEEAKFEAPPAVDEIAYQLPAHVFREIATTEATQGVVALVRMPESRLEQVFGGAGPAAALLLDGIQDPGNAGAMVRAAEAFGGTGVVFLKTTVSPYNPKCLRGSAGSLFRVPFVSHPPAEEVREAIRTGGVTLYSATASAEATPIDDIDWTGPSAIVIGSEGRGVSEAWRSGAIPVRIPTTGVESLNAAVAAAVILYELRRSRQREQVR